MPNSPQVFIFHRLSPLGPNSSRTGPLKGLLDQCGHSHTLGSPWVNAGWGPEVKHLKKVTAFFFIPCQYSAFSRHLCQQDYLVIQMSSCLAQPDNQVTVTITALLKIS